jgi:hypothetical protein
LPLHRYRGIFHEDVYERGKQERTKDNFSCFTDGFRKLNYESLFPFYLRQREGDLRRLNWKHMGVRKMKRNEKRIFRADRAPISGEVPVVENIGFKI